MTKVSPIGRVSYPSVFEANEYEGKRNYQLTLLFDKKTVDLAEMKAEAARVAKEKFGKDIPKNFDNPIRDGDEKAEETGHEEYRGCWYIRFKRPEKRGKPEVVDQRKEDIAADSGDFYAGCYARVSFTCFAWDGKKKGDGGVSFSLGNIQKAKDGESFDGRTKAENDFDEMEDTGGSDLF